jgi:hypothetical protein
LAYDRDADQRAKLTDIVVTAFRKQGWDHERGPGWPIRRQFVTRYVSSIEVIIVDVTEIVQRLLDAQ